MSVKVASPKTPSLEHRYNLRGSPKKERPNPASGGGAHFPRVSYRRSNVALAGHGLFAEEFIEKGTIVTEYGGAVVYRETAIRLRDDGEDTHLRSLSKGFDAIDGRISSELSLEYYKKNNLMGSFVNDPHGTKYSSNCMYFRDEQSRQHPNGDTATVRIWIKATR